jgi:hypothetical protein
MNNKIYLVTDADNILSGYNSDEIIYTVLGIYTSKQMLEAIYGTWKRKIDNNIYEYVLYDNISVIVYEIEANKIMDMELKYYD